MSETYRMPAEWAPHEATWISWPKDPITFPKEIRSQVENIYVQMIVALQPGEKVHLLVDDKKTEDKVLKMVEAASGTTKNLHIHQIKTVDVWMRDYGPIFVKSSSGKLRITKWVFNAWGGKYEELMKDNVVVDHILPIIGNPDIVKTGIILEGGSIEVNGEGTLLTSEQCLLNKNRNKNMTKAQIEAALRDNLGVSNILWAKEGVAGDDTDGHIDDFARFVNTTTVLCAVEDDKSDENYAVTNHNFELLKTFKDQDGQSLDVVPLPMPGVVRSKDGGRLPASYANFYIGNAAILLPVFNHKNDQKAIDILSKYFPDRKVVPIFCTPLVYGFGGIHCVTQQQPK